MGKGLVIMKNIKKRSRLNHRKANYSFGKFGINEAKAVGIGKVEIV